MNHDVERPDGMRMPKHLGSRLRVPSFKGFRRNRSQDTSRRDLTGEHTPPPKDASQPPSAGSLSAKNPLQNGVLGSEHSLESEDTTDISRGLITLKLSPAESTRFSGVFQKIVPTELLVRLNGSDWITRTNMAVHWLDDLFVPVHDQAIEVLKDEKLYDPSDSCTRIYLQSGRAYLIFADSDSDNVATESCLLNSAKDWRLELQDLMGKFFLNRNKAQPGIAQHDREIKLRIHLEFKTLRIEEGRLATTIPNTLEYEAETNFEEKEYIPRKVIQRIFDEETINRLIDDDMSLEDDMFGPHCTWKTRKEFVQSVVQNGVELMALCVHCGIDLACLYQFLSRYVNDKDWGLPLYNRSLKDEDRPACVTPRKFKDLRMYQAYFKAHVFGLHTHTELQKWEVAPIAYVPSEKKAKLGRGGFGTVYKVKVHPDHHQFDPVSSMVLSEDVLC